MTQQGYTDADLDSKSNKWPLLGTYLDQKPDTPHKQLLREMTLGFWKEYSSISHVSHDGLLEIFPYIATEDMPHRLRPNVAEGVERLVALHFGRTAGVLLCLLSEIQLFCKFDGFDIDQRLSDMWTAIQPMIEIRELYELRYKALLRKQASLP